MLLEQIPVIFMDVRMPVMDGIEATREIRNAGIQSHIVGVTGGTTSEEKKACLIAGMDQFLSKPAQAIELKEKISAYLKA